MPGIRFVPSAPRPTIARTARLLLVVAGFLFATSVSHADGPMDAEGPVLLHDGGSHASRAGGGGDTTWVGHRGSGTLPNSGAPWFIGVGPNQPGVSADGYWGWDNHAPGANDSLQGWWPFRREYLITGSLTLPDHQRPWWGLDYGNQVNYVLNAGQPNRTRGVTGVWHVDGGSTVPHSAGGPSPGFAPISGAGSAWCGLRAHGDLNYLDPATGNPFDQTVAEINRENPTGSGTSKNYPGYGSQWDQMLYRDVAVSDGGSLTLSFDYATQMSTSFDANAATRVGWFDQDPLSTAAGNFISSSSADLAAPVDSFMVYVGAPADLASSRRSDGVSRPVYDPQRRWFSEVLDITSPGTTYRELMSVAGIHPTSSVSDLVIDNAVIQPILDAQAGVDGVVRLVFRVKTNRGFDDETTAFSSLARGAVLVDNVSLTGGVAPLSSGFDAPTEIDNNVEANGAALKWWKSTGKPPAVYFHAHPLLGADIDGGPGDNTYQPLAYEDLCGPPGSPTRQCNLSGVVISVGNHDDQERPGGAAGTAEREVISGMISPTINLVIGDGDNDTDVDAGVNALGITSDDVVVTDDYYVGYELYAGIYNQLFQGNTFQIGAQCYPARQPGNLLKVWGERDYYLYYSAPTRNCFSTVEGLNLSGLIHTSNATGVPDSIRIIIANAQSCFRFSLSLGCSPVEGGYFDNVSFGMVDLPALSTSGANAIGSMSVEFWRWINDAFPANATPGLPGTAPFDTAAAHLMSGYNIAQNTGDMTRPAIPGDTMTVTATGADMRVDLVFRVLPGVGNYVVVGDKNSGLRRVPTSVTAASAGDGSFWGEYLASNDGGSGFGTPGGHAGGVWSAQVWNATRCDTSELNIFRVSAKAVGGPTTSPTNFWASMYHEGDPKILTLGISRNICFLADTSVGAPTTSSNITCGPGGPGGAYPPTWITTVPQSRTGWNGSSTTKEYTKILPDGLLTPGAHVQYFFRKHEIPTGAFIMAPDTGFITPQARETSTDGHRFQQFGVLPDRWKDIAFGGAGMACMLYVDLADRRGNERAWVGIADSICATASSKFGAHNGWHAGNDVNYTSLNVGGNPSIAVWRHGGQPGTTWDMYGVKGSESTDGKPGSIGSRSAPQPTGLAAGKGARIAPTKEMLRTYYGILMILTADLAGGVLGPGVNNGSDDVGTLIDYLSTTAGSPQPRGLWIMGENFVDGLSRSGENIAAQQALLNDYLATSFRSASYQALVGTPNVFIDLLPTTVITGATGGPLFSMQSPPCVGGPDVLEVNSAISGATAASFYESLGPDPPYVASVYAPSSGARPYITLVDGFDIADLRTQDGVNARGRIHYFYDVFTNVFGPICAVNGSPACVLDVPNGGDGDRFVNSFGLANVPLARGLATVRLTLAQRDRVEVRLYDVAGRTVRTLADREFEAGEHLLRWDGSGDDGRALPRGTYFARVRHARSGFEQARKIVVLK